MIGLIFGETDFPKYIYRKIKNKKKYIIIDLTNRNLFKKDKNAYKVSIGQFGKIISILKENNCNRVLFAGKVNKPNFSKLKLDFKGVYYISKIIKKSKIGDAAILKEIIKILSHNKIKTENSTILLVFTKVKMMLRQLLSQSFPFTESHITQTTSENIGLIKGIKCVIEKTGVLI